MDNRNDGKETQSADSPYPRGPEPGKKLARLKLIARHGGLARLERWVAQNDPVTLTLHQAAAIASLEPHYFSRVFRECVGETFVKWRRRQRISKAMELMRSGPHSMSEVVNLAGYRERRSLERGIKAITGETPWALKQLCREAHEKADLRDESQGAPQTS